MSEIAYVRLKGGDPPGETKGINLVEGNPDSCADLALQKLAGIAYRFLVEGEPYRSLVHPMWKSTMAITTPRARQGMGGVGRRKRV